MVVYFLHGEVTTFLDTTGALEIQDSDVRLIDTVKSVLDDVVYSYECELLAMVFLPKIGI